MKNTFNLFTCANFNPYLKIITCRGLHSNNYAHCAIVRFPQESVAKERLLKLLRSVYFSSQSVSIGTRADCGAAGLKNVSHISCHPHIHALIMYIAYMYIHTLGLCPEDMSGEISCSKSGECPGPHIHEEREW